MTIFDSNIWIAYFDADDQTHKQAYDTVSRHGFVGVLVTEYIVLEVTTILKQKKGYALALQFLDFLEDFDIPILESSDFYAKTKRHFRTLQERQLSFVDVSLVALSEEYKIITLDKHLKKLIKQ